MFGLDVKQMQQEIGEFRDKLDVLQRGQETILKRQAQMMDWLRRNNDILRQMLVGRKVPPAVPVEDKGKGE